MTGLMDVPYYMKLAMQSVKVTYLLSLFDLLQL